MGTVRRTNQVQWCEELNVALLTRGEVRRAPDVLEDYQSVLDWHAGRVLTHFLTSSGYRYVKVRESPKT